MISPMGDRQLAGLLSALAEAPDFTSAASYLLERIVDLTRTKRGCMLRIDPAQDSLVVVASHDLDESPRAPSLAELSNPLVLAALSLSAVPELSDLEAQGFGSGAWSVIPFSQPRVRGAPPLLPPQQASEIAMKAGVKLASVGERRLGTAPAGVILLSGSVAMSALEGVADVVSLASPVIARLASLQDALDASDRLRQQRERLTLMVDSLPDPVVITDASNDIIAQNQRAVRLLNVQEGDSSGRRRAIELNNLLFTSFLSRAVMTGRAASGIETPRELNLVDPDEGTDLLFEVLAHPLGARVGPEDAVLSVLRDVTDLRRAANELERQVQRVRLAEQKATGERDRLNLILENVADPILVTDERSNIILMNDQAEKLFEVLGNEPRSRRELQAVQGNDTKFTSFISEFALLATDARRERMTLQQPASGRELPVEVVSGKIRNDRGEAIAIVSVLHDRTKEVEVERLYEALKRLNSELEERIREATADLAEQNARLQWQSQEVERANRLKSEFLASMSHELRTPINALIGYTALLLDGVLGEINTRQSDALQRGRAAAEHLLALINDILDLAKIEAGKMPLHPESVALREVIQEVAPQVEPMVRKKALELRIEVANDCPVIHTDRTKVKQVLLNLLSNAVKFTNRGTVTVEARCAPGGVCIDVVDTGIGIRESDLQAIWEDFRQVDQSRTREYGGTGLGLSITRKLLDRLGGSVAVKSVYGEGSTFSVFLPLRVPMPPFDEVAPLAIIKA
jgi:PAS domain S-box-containing protein